MNRIEQIQAVHVRHAFDIFPDDSPFVGPRFPYWRRLLEPRKHEFSDVFLVLPCVHENALYDSYFFEIKEKIYQICAGRCCVKHGLKLAPVVRELNRAAGTAVRLSPKWNQSRAEKFFPRIEIDVMRKVFAEMRSRIPAIECYPGPPNSGDFYCHSDDVTRAFTEILDERMEEIIRSENRRAQFEKKELLLWRHQTRRAMAVLRKFLKMPTEKHREAYRLHERALKQAPTFPIL